MVPSERGPELPYLRLRPAGHATSAGVEHALGDDVLVESNNGAIDDGEAVHEAVGSRNRQRGTNALYLGRASLLLRGAR